MKGAATGELAAKMMKADSMTSTIKIGANQNFLRTFMNSQNSLTKDILAPPQWPDLLYK
jgi:hypothetical protein